MGWIDVCEFVVSVQRSGKQQIHAPQARLERQETCVQKRHHRTIVVLPCSQKVGEQPCAIVLLQLKSHTVQARGHELFKVGKQRSTGMHLIAFMHKPHVQINAVMQWFDQQVMWFLHKNREDAYAYALPQL